MCHLLKCIILTGDRAKEIIFQNRITLYCENDYPFTFKRCQFLIRLAFAMTINKSQVDHRARLFKKLIQIFVKTFLDSVNITLLYLELDHKKDQKFFKIKVTIILKEKLKITYLEKCIHEKLLQGVNINFSSTFKGIRLSFYELCI